MYCFRPINNLLFSEAFPVQMGYFVCKPGETHNYSLGNFIIYYVCKGSGVLQGKNRTHTVHAGQAFVVFPNRPSIHVADMEHPWEYAWAEFAGASMQEILLSAGISIHNPIIQDTPDGKIGAALLKLLNASHSEKTTYHRLLALSWNFMDNLLAACKDEGDTMSMSEKYIEQALSYIHAAPTSKLTVTELAKRVGVDRSYLTQVFKRHCNISPKQYMVNYRIELAKNMLNNPQLTVSAIAEELGYSDAFAFMKAFKKQTQITTTQYREMTAANKKT